MLKVITGYIGIDSEELMVELSGVLNDQHSECRVEEEEPDFIIVTEFSPEFTSSLHNDGYITEDTMWEANECDSLKFYIN